MFAKISDTLFNRAGIIIAITPNIKAMKSISTMITEIAVVSLGICLLVNTFLLSIRLMDFDIGFNMYAIANPHITGISISTNIFIIRKIEGNLKTAIAIINPIAKTISTYAAIVLYFLFEYNFKSNSSVNSEKYTLYLLNYTSTYIKNLGYFKKYFRVLV